MGYIYETHCHTAEVSRCAIITGAELARFYKSIGFDGLCVTDHFLNGNTIVPRNIPWEQQVELFCRGYENALSEGRKIGIDVFFGWEYSYRGTDLLTFGLDREWLLNHPESVTVGVNDYCDLVHRSGGFIIHAHPFREADYIDMIRLLPRKVDAVEVINACRTDFENDRAREYADNYGLLQAAGSDNHKGPLEMLAGIIVPNRLMTVNDMIEAIKNNTAELFTITYKHGRYE